MTAPVIPSPKAIPRNPLSSQSLSKVLVMAQDPVTTLSTPQDPHKNPNKGQRADLTTEWMGITVSNAA